MPRCPRTCARTSASMRAWCASRSASRTWTTSSPSSSTRWTKTISLLVVLAGLALLVGAGLAYMIAMPGASYARALPPLIDEERALAARLKRHVEVLAAAPRNGDLATPARYITEAFARHGLNAQLHAFRSG